MKFSCLSDCHKNWWTRFLNDLQATFHQQGFYYKLIEFSIASL